VHRCTALLQQRGDEIVEVSAPSLASSKVTVKGSPLQSVHQARSDSINVSRAPAGP